MRREAVIVADLTYGDAGKGSVVDYLANQAQSALVVRFNGGPQAAHNVTTPDGRHHTFAQFGSGTFVPGARTHLSRFMLVNPFNLYGEERHLREVGVGDAWERLTVDSMAKVITPWHQSANRIRELARGDRRHGSCGQGIGETMADSINTPDLTVRVSDFYSTRLLQQKLERVRDYKREQLGELIDQLPDNDQVKQELALMNDPLMVDQCLALYQDFSRRAQIVDKQYFDVLLERADKVIFEGAQGVLLDEWFGFHPYTTWSTTTFENALTILDEHGFDGQVTRLGLTRGYATRHGPGPFVTEDAELSADLPDLHNGHNRWQLGFRVGYTDLVALRYAIEVCGGIDALGVTCLDRMEYHAQWQIATAYSHPATYPDLEPYLTRDASGAIQLIHADGKDNLDHQERLTQLLFACQPLYQRVDLSSGSETTAPATDINQLLGLLVEELQTPVMLTSFGPVRTDKRTLVAC